MHRFPSATIVLLSALALLAWNRASSQSPTTLPGPHASHASSTRFGFVQKLAPDDLHVVGEVQIDPNPGEIVLSPDGNHYAYSFYRLISDLYVVHGLR